MNGTAPAAPCVGDGPPTHTCPLCGARFRGRGEACAGCLLAARSGGMVCCPRCRHVFPERSYLLDLITRWWRRKGGGR